MTDLRETVARAILDDLEDRRGIKSELQMVARESPEIYEEIKRAIADAAIVAVLEGVRGYTERFSALADDEAERTLSVGLAQVSWERRIDALIAQHKPGETE